MERRKSDKKENKFGGAMHFVRMEGVMK